MSRVWDSVLMLVRPDGSGGSHNSDTIDKARTVMMTVCTPAGIWSAVITKFREMLGFVMCHASDHKYKPELCEGQVGMKLPRNLPAEVVRRPKLHR